jgi:two-component system, OmpR family, phosphate regulon response regulator PhoB
MGLVLVVDDDAAIRTVVRWQLVDAGFEVVEADDGPAALRRIQDDRPALVVLDLTLPGLGGLDVIRTVRTGRAGRSDLPIIVLSGRSGETDRIVGLDLGADDYLVKPFSPGELAARVRSVLRRSSPELSGEVIVVGALRIEPAGRRVVLAEVDVELTPKEFDLLAFLARHPGQVLTREMLLERVWDYDYTGGTRTVDVHIRWLREKIEPDPSRPRYIHTIFGVGYKLDVTEGATPLTGAVPAKPGA